jgi:hypothetical protein
MLPMNRRQFLQMSSAFVTSSITPDSLRQTFDAGIVPAGKTSSISGMEAYWNHCDEVSRLGFHRIEVNNTRAGIAECYTEQIPEFKDAMTARNLSMVGLAQFSHAAQGGNLQSLIDQHMLIGRFLAAVGGQYITHMISHISLPAEPTSERYVKHTGDVSFAFT